MSSGNGDGPSRSSRAAGEVAFPVRLQGLSLSPLAGGTWPGFASSLHFALLLYHVFGDCQGDGALLSLFSSKR